MLKDAENGKPKRDTIVFQAPKRIWEYVFIKENNKTIVPDRLRLEAERMIIDFTQFEVVHEFGREEYRANGWNFRLKGLYKRSALREILFRCDILSLDCESHSIE